jgi:hypothetical protein
MDTSGDDRVARWEEGESRRDGGERAMAAAVLMVFATATEGSMLRLRGVKRLLRKEAMAGRGGRKINTILERKGGEGVGESAQGNKHPPWVGRTTSWTGVTLFPPFFFPGDTCLGLLGKGKSSPTRFWSCPCSLQVRYSTAQTRDRYTHPCGTVQATQDAYQQQGWA